MLIAVIIAAMMTGIRVNLTPSYPLGLWRIVPLGREVAIGDVVLICPPPIPEFERARERGYLSRGLCPGWFSPLIKSVVALPLQRIQTSDIVTIDGRALPHSEIHSRDAAGRSLDPHPGGIIPPGHAFVHSGSAGSYDSRYFGPIPVSGLLGLARPVFTYSP